ncbi:LOW QUALITY PROTEIN: granzyme A-like [Onychostruthus taczanowskii]|uniref:LOW QUALITY PROTEIN: granzyme A-like n=1 Tax=Onychostruthus taczanowskii TaxID=356909 RepID=UPI001B80A227|nr:LOW QUALITY PROTEIN: granzyme A-like [Onychostruthus taczanowskii]
MLLKLNKYVQLLPLPDFFEDVEPGTLCQVAGWGRHITRKAIKISPEIQVGHICAGQCCGMVSFEEECENISIPGVYTQLTEEYIDWIKRTVRQIYETRAFQ